jgi:hypothetical protein
MIVFSSALVLSRVDDETSDLPMILWESLVTVSNITADEEDADYPATNMANPQTSSLWKSGSTVDGYITVTLSGSDETDSLAVARHNWGSGLVVVSVEGELAGIWSEVVEEQLLGDDAPAMFVFEADFYTGLRFKLQPASVEPQAAVVYAGATLTVERNVQPGFQPIRYARDRQMLNGVAMNGDFIGNIITSERLASTFDVHLLDGDWYWENMQPFVTQAMEPFFLAMFPDTEPENVAYCWATNNPRPMVSQITGEVDISMQLGGLGL